MFSLHALFDWLASSIESSWFWLVPLASLAESTAIVSLAAPGLLVLLFSGYSAGLGTIPLIPVILLAVIGTMIGDILSYVFGTFLWNRCLNKTRFGPSLAEISKYAIAHNSWFMWFFHFSGYARAFVPLSVGAMRMPFRRFIAFEIVGAVLWNVSFGLLGYIVGSFGTSVEVIFKNQYLIELVFLAIFLLWVAGIAVTARKFLRQRRLQGDSHPS